ncbi:MAG: MFS transporter [Myxococcota bacterium]
MKSTARFAYLYFLYLAASAMMSTYWPYHLEGLGLSQSAIGSLFASTTAIAVVTQLTLAGFSARLDRPALLMGAALCATALIACSLPWVSSAWGFVALFGLMMVPRSTILPLTDAITVQAIGSEGYDRVRAWGTIGYGSAAALFGLLTHQITYAEAGWWATVAFAAMLSATLVALPGLYTQLPQRPPPSPSTSQPNSDLRGLIRQPLLVRLLLLGAFHWGGITIFNIYTPLHTKALGYSNAVPGAIVAMAIIAEVVGFSVASRLFRWRAAHRWMPIIFALGIGRWIATGLVTSVPALIALQAMHMITFGVWLSANMRLLGFFAPDEHRSGVQSLFFATTFGAGGVLGAMLGGWIMEHHGGASTFFAAAGLDLIALLMWTLSLRTWTPKEMFEATNT